MSSTSCEGRVVDEHHLCRCFSGLMVLTHCYGIEILFPFMAYFSNNGIWKLKLLHLFWIWFCLIWSSNLINHSLLLLLNSLVVCHGSVRVAATCGQALGICGETAPGSHLLHRVSVLHSLKPLPCAVSSAVSSDCCCYTSLLKALQRESISLAFTNKTLLAEHRTWEIHELLLNTN